MTYVSTLLKQCKVYRFINKNNFCKSIKALIANGNAQFNILPRKKLKLVFMTQQSLNPVKVKISLLLHSENINLFLKRSAIRLYYLCTTAGSMADKVSSSHSCIVQLRSGDLVTAVIM